MTSLADVARMRLVSQRLIEPMPSPGDVVRHLTCVQGQDFPGSSASVALRTCSRSLGGVRTAYDAGDIVRSWPMRGTLFVVPAEDLGWMLGLTAEKVLRGSGRRRAELGLDDTTLAKAEEVARAALKDTGSVVGLVRADLLSRWQQAGIETTEGRGYHLIFNLAVRGVICLGPTEGTSQRFVLSDDWIASPRSLEGEEAVAEWFRRYVMSHGPVPVADFLWWSKLLKRDLAPVLAYARTEFEVLEVVGTHGSDDPVEHWVSPDVLEAYPGVKRATSTPLLLPGFDELVLGYGDRRVILSKEEEALVVPGNNGVFRGTVVRGGTAIGTWKRAARKGATVSVEPFGAALPAVVERALPALTADLPV